MRGETNYSKGDKNRLSTSEQKKYEDSKLWDNFAKNKAEKEAKKRLLAEQRNVFWQNIE